MNSKKIDPAARRALFFSRQAAEAKRIADDRRIRAAASKFRIERFIDEANKRWIETEAAAIKLTFNGEGV